MGIQGLNRFMRSNCLDGIKQICLWELKGKTIAVDASIYMYRFQGEGALIDGIYQMVSLMHYHRITAIFVFDGKPPAEKHDLLQKRREDKAAAEAAYKNVQERIKTCDEDDLADLETEADNLRKQFIRLTQEDIDTVKNLLTLMGVNYYECEGESDSVCAKMVQKKIAYACLSEDMDMFVYGCPRVLRYLSLLKSNVVLYDLGIILNQLHLSFEDFQTICVVSGTDYNMAADSNIELHRALKLFAKYKKRGSGEGYQDWIVKNNYINDNDTLDRTKMMFDMNDLRLNRKYLIESEYNEIGMRNFLLSYGFVFAC